ncbi:MAG: hypothetical protein JSS22_11315 [Proteobacteria bacterium]|nr:hypothetical protein [Pseudomonadota bacterium]
MLTTLRHLIVWYRAYTDNADPLARIANVVAMIVAGNQPFYPLYLHAIVGTAAWPAWLTLLTMPFFAAVPAVARRNSLAGRALLLATGIANNILCVKLIGAATAVQLFYLPCILLAAVLFRRTERAVMLPLLGLPFATYFFVDGKLGPPLAVFANGQYASVASLHAVSVASLIAVIGLLLSSILSDRNV